MDWINFIDDQDNWQLLVNIIMNVKHYKTCNFLTSCRIVFQEGLCYKELSTWLVGWLVGQSVGR